MTVVAVGDLMLGDSPITVGYGVRSRYGGGQLSSLFHDVRSALVSAELVFGNLETVLAQDSLERSRLRSEQMRGSPEYAKGLREAGFTVLNLANNHAMQHGGGAFRATVEALEGVGIKCCGLRGEHPWSSRPVVVKSSSGAVGVLGYSLRPRQYGSGVPLFATGTAEAICEDVARLSDAVDRVIVSLHWGEEFVERPSCKEVSLARAVIDAGATLILGHHPHVLRPIERYGRGLIAYSLGNFVSDMIWTPELRRSVVLRCRLGSGGVESVETAPVRITADYRPVLVPEGAEDDGDLIRDRAASCYSEAEYRKATRIALRAQRVAAYRHALFRLHRYPPMVLASLAFTTVRNKASALLEWFGDL